MSKYSEKRARRLEMANAAIDAIGRVERDETADAAAARGKTPPPAPKRRPPVDLGGLPGEFALAMSAANAALRIAERLAGELEERASPGIQRGDATSMARMLSAKCLDLRGLEERARRYAAAWDWRAQ